MKINPKHIIIFSLLFSIFIVLPSCNEDEITPKATDYSYFPFKVGNWIEYSITDINIDKASNVYDTLRYSIKEISDSLFLDNINQPTMRIERYIKYNQQDQWEIKDVWYANLLKESAQKVEENIRLIKLVFPATLNQKWNGNAYNTNETEEYKITSIDKQETINNISFESVLTVTQKSDESLIHKYYKVEKFAKNIGLVYKKDVNINSQTLNGLPIEQRIDMGSVYIQQVTQTGILNN